MKKIICWVLAAVCLMLAGCNKPETKDDGLKSLMLDPMLTQGVEVIPPGTRIFNDLDAEFPGYTGKLVIDYNKNAKEGGPLSTLSQHGSQYSLADPKYSTPIVKGDEYTYKDPGKSFTYNIKTGEHTLAVVGSNEYSEDDDGDGVRDGINYKPRTGSEVWAHLLLSSGVYPQPTMNELNALNFKIKFRMNQMDLIAPELFAPGKHTAQFQLFFVVKSKSAALANEFIWFGIPFWEATQPNPGPTDIFDKGTSSVIYSMGSQKTIGEPIEKDKLYSIDYNIMPEIKKALDTAQNKYGIFKGTTFDQLYIQNFNIGWEVPGIYDVSATISDFDLRADIKDEYKDLYNE